MCPTIRARDYKDPKKVLVRQIDVQEPKLLGGLGEKKSNGGSQYYQQDRVYSSDGIAMCIPSSIPGGSYRYLVKQEPQEPQLTRFGNLFGRDKGSGYAGNVWDRNGLCPTLDTMQGGYRQPMVIECTE